MRKILRITACAVLLVAVATPGFSGIVLWQDGFNDASQWQLNALSPTLNGTSVTFSAVDPFVYGTAMRMSSSEVLPWYADAFITNTVLNIAHLDYGPPVPPEQVIVLRVYADTYSQPVLNDAYKIESQIIQSFSTPGNYVTSFGSFTWGTTAGGELPSYVNFVYELAGAPWQEGMLFTADHFSYSVIPEPGTLVIGSILAGLSGVGLRRKRARKATT